MTRLGQAPTEREGQLAEIFKAALDVALQPSTNAYRRAGNKGVPSQVLICLLEALLALDTLSDYYRGQVEARLAAARRADDEVRAYRAAKGGGS